MDKKIEEIRKSKIINCVTSDLRNLLYEVELNTLNIDVIFQFFSDLLLSANVDSKIVVEILEKFGKEEKYFEANEIAHSIKVTEGW